MHLPLQALPLLLLDRGPGRRRLFAQHGAAHRLIEAGPVDHVVAGIGEDVGPSDDGDKRQDDQCADKGRQNAGTPARHTTATHRLMVKTEARKPDAASWTETATAVSDTTSSLSTP